MRLRIVHTTTFRYDEPVSEAYMEMRLRPLDAGGQRCESFRAVIVVRTAAPDRAFVKLKDFRIDTAEYHRGEASVPNGQGFEPLARGPWIPERQGIGGAGCCARNRACPVCVH